VAVLAGEIGKQVRISNPQSLDRALDTAMVAQEAIRQERANESFQAKKDRPVRLTSRPQGRTRRRSEPRNRLTIDSTIENHGKNPEAQKEGYSVVINAMDPGTSNETVLLS
jgi:hypothetical protein